MYKFSARILSSLFHFRLREQQADGGVVANETHKTENTKNNDDDDDDDEAASNIFTYVHSCCCP